MYSCTRVGEKGPWKQPDQIDRQLTLNDKYGVLGSVHFSAKQIREDRLGAVSRYKKNHYAAPALLPPMAQLPAAPPAAPLLVAARSAAGGAVEFDWQAGPGAEPASWALYRVEGAAAKLVATGRGGAKVRDPQPPATAAQYCLSGLDRSGNESPLSAARGVSP